MGEDQSARGDGRPRQETLTGIRAISTALKDVPRSDWLALLALALLFALVLYFA